MGWQRGAVAGAAAGAAGTTVLNTLTYLDMTVRARPTSSTPQDTVEKLSEKSGVPIPGDDDSRSNRLDGLGPLTGVLAGVGTGAALGAARGLGLRLPAPLSVVAASLGALAISNGPMAALGITDPRRWGAKDWAADVIPHVGYGVATAWVLDRLNSE